MKRSLAAVAVALTVGVAGCDSRDGTRASAGNGAPAEAATAATPAAPAAPTPSAAPPAGSATPAFADLYPGATVEGEPTTADGPAGPGGLVTFTTDAAPEAVVAFYRERAEKAGLVSVMSMNQGEARAYGAVGQAGGASVQVVAQPDEGATSVQLSWSAGG